MPRTWMQRRRWSLVLAALAALLVVRSASGEPPRTAVLVSEALRGETVGDLLSVELGRRGVSLVERAELDKIAAEQTLSALFGDAGGSRVKLGRLLGARCLALLDRPTTSQGRTEAVRLQVIDVATGLRLGSELALAGSPDTAEALARALADAVFGVWERFPNGVESVVAVTPWLSENLTREYDALQTALAQLLVTSLQQQPGLAVVEIDEARRIERERALGGIEVASIPAPWVVEGRFELQPVEPDHPRAMTLSATMRRAGATHEPQTWRQDNVPIDQVGSIVSTQTASAVRHALSKDVVDGPTDAAGMFKSLVERADRFSTIGMWAEAAALREAALVADPNHDHATAQRLAVAWDYAWLLKGGFVQGWPEPRNPSVQAAWSATIRHRLDLWRRAMWHVEYLIMNRRIDDRAAVRIAGTLLAKPRYHSLMVDDVAQALIAADGDRRRFVREVLPHGLNLPPRSQQIDFRPSVAAIALDGAVKPYYGRMTETDLNLFAALLMSLLPADVPPAGTFIDYELGGYYDQLPREHFESYKRVDVEPPVTSEQWIATMRRLASQSRDERPAAWGVGEFALLAMDGWRLDRGDGARRQVLYERTCALGSEWRRLAERMARQQDDLDRAIDMMCSRLRPRPPLASIANSDPRREATWPQATIGDGLERVDLRVVGNSHEAPDYRAMRWLDVLPVEGQPQGLLNIWVSLSAVYYERKLGELEPKLYLHRLHCVTAARWDGRYAWIADPYAGVHLLDAAGESVAMFDKAAGLPEGTATILVQPLGDGRAIAAGSNKPDLRSWIAELWLDEHGRPRVKVIHVAVNQIPGEDLGRNRYDPEAACELRYLWLWNRGKSGKYLIVGRGGAYYPLAVNLESRRVTTIGPKGVIGPYLNPFYKKEQRWHTLRAVTASDGTPTNLLLWAGHYGVALCEVGAEPIGPALTFMQIDKWSSRGDLDAKTDQPAGCLIPLPDGSMVFAGSLHGGWARIRVDLDGPKPRLISKAISPSTVRDFTGNSTLPATGHGIIVWGTSPRREPAVFRVKLANPADEAKVP